MCPMWEISLPQAALTGANLRALYSSILLEVRSFVTDISRLANTLSVKWKSLRNSFRTLYLTSPSEQ